MTARGTPSERVTSSPVADLVAQVQDLQKRYDTLAELVARDWLVYPLRLQCVKIDDTPTFQISIVNPISGGSILLGTA